MFSFSLSLKGEEGNLSSVRNVKPSCSDSFELSLSCYGHKAEKYIETGREKSSEHFSFIKNKQTPLQPQPPPRKIQTTIHTDSHHPESGPWLLKQGWCGVWKLAWML